MFRAFEYLKLSFRLSTETCELQKGIIKSVITIYRLLFMRIACSNCRATHNHKYVTINFLFLVYISFQLGLWGIFVQNVPVCARAQLHRIHIYSNDHLHGTISCDYLSNNV